MRGKKGARGTGLSQSESHGPMYVIKFVCIQVPRQSDNLKKPTTRRMGTRDYASSADDDVVVARPKLAGYS